MARYSEVLLDANFLTLPQQHKVDIIGEIKKLVPGAAIMTIQPVTKELAKIRQGRIGMEMIKHGVVKVVAYKSESTDKAIAEYALANKAIVATNDKELKQQLRKLDVPVIYLRERKKLELEGAVE